MPAQRTSAIRRRVYFYRCWTDGDDGERIPYDFEALRSGIEECLKSGDRYLALDEDEVVSIWPDEFGGRFAMTVGIVRRRGLPQLEDRGAIMPLSIADGQGLIEQTHFLALEDGILGAEFNFYGPRIGRLAHFTRLKVPDVPVLRTELLVNRDATERVRNLEDIRLVRLRVNRGYTDLFRQASDNLQDGLDATLDRYQGGEAELVIKTERGSRRGLGREVFDWVLGLAGEQRTREGADKFEVKGRDRRTERVELVDLLKDRLVSTRQVSQVRERYRAVDSMSMFWEIEAAYEELRESVREAAGLEG